MRNKIKHAIKRGLDGSKRGLDGSGYVKDIGSFNFDNQHPDSNPDPVALEVLHYIWQTAHDKGHAADYPDFDSFLNSTARNITWWPNGKLMRANLQGTMNWSSTEGWRLVGDDALPENFGDAFSEVNYLDIGLTPNEITYLPESIGKLWNYSHYELIDRNGGVEANYLIIDSFWGNIDGYNHCKNLYNNIIWNIHDENYDWDLIYTYYMVDPICKNVQVLNMHIDGNDTLGRYGSIPSSIENWTKLETLWGMGGIGRDLDDEENQGMSHINFHNWRMTYWYPIQPTPNFTVPNETFCAPISHTWYAQGGAAGIPIEYITMEDWNNDFTIQLLLERRFGIDWDPDYCLEYWGSYW